MEDRSEKNRTAENRSEDLFRELGNIGAGSSMTSLAHMIGRQVHGSLPVILSAEYGSMMDWFGRTEENVVGVLVPFSGDLSGLLLQVYRKDMVKAILKGLYGSEADKSEMDGSLLNLLRETANITASSYLTALASYGDWRLDVLDSAVSMDMAGSIITEFSGMAAALGENCCVGNRFGTDGKDRESCMLLVLPRQTENSFMEVLGVQR